MTTSKIMLQKHGIRAELVRKRPTNDNGLDANMLAVLSLVDTLKRTMALIEGFHLANPDDPRFLELAVMINAGVQDANELY